MSERPLAEDLEPRRIVEELDRHVVGQRAAKRAVAIAMRNRWRRLQLDAKLRREVSPRNILLMGPTGVGKTEIARRIATLVGAPFLKVEATKFTEVGYVGRDVDSIIRDLVEVALGMEQTEERKRVQVRARERAEARVLDALLASWRPGDPDLDPFGPASSTGTSMQDMTAVRVRLRERLRSGSLDARQVEIEWKETTSHPLASIFQDPSFAQTGPDFAKLLERMQPKQSRSRKTTVKEALVAVAAEEAETLLEAEPLTERAVRRAEEAGIVFIDEIDKVAVGEGRAQGADVSREGVQRDLLPIIEGSVVSTKHGPVRTDHILFICAGAFHVSKPSDLLPELQGRLPLRVRLDALTEEDFVRILVEPEASLVKQHAALLRTEGVELEVREDGVREIARVAAEANARHENIGARRLSTVLERVLDEVSFEAPSLRNVRVVVDGAYVRARVADLLEDEDLGRYVL